MRSLGLAAMLGGVLAAGVAAAQPAPTPSQAPTPDWLPQKTIELRALDKVSARSITLTGPIGQALKFGSLVIDPVACVVRPPDRAADAAAFLVITDRHGGPGFKGWMVMSAPALMALEHPVYDIRLMGCRP